MPGFTIEDTDTVTPSWPSYASPLSYEWPGKWSEKLRATLFSFLKGTFSEFLPHALFSPRELRISQSVKQETGLRVTSTRARRRRKEINPLKRTERAGECWGLLLPLLHLIFYD